MGSSVGVNQRIDLRDLREIIVEGGRNGMPEESGG